MRLLVFGDVHGNLVALEELFRRERLNYDQVVCHGDIVNYGPWSNECITFLADMKEAIFLKGNHEQYFIDSAYPGKNEVAKSFFQFCYPMFHRENLPIISRFESVAYMDGFEFKHSIDGLYFFADTDISEVNFADNTVIGHSHQQFHRNILGKNLYNTGSLGQNRALLDVANYLIIDTVSRKVELKSFTFNVDLVINEMSRMQYPSICLDYYKSKKTFNTYAG